MKPPPAPRKALLALVTLLALSLVGAPVAVHKLGGDATPARLANATGATQWADEPAAAALLQAAGADRAAADRPGAEQFYFVLPDRFANGDPGNDRGGLAGDRLSTGYDPTDKGFYQGGDLKGVLDRLDYIQGLGTTAIWLAPVFKNRPVQGTGDDVSAGYHGYWITDFTELDPHFGTKAELRKLVRQAHQRGIKIYLDVIVNHTADVIRYSEDEYSYLDKTTEPYRDAEGRPFEDRNFAAGSRDFPEVDTDSFPYTPTFATPADAKVKVPAWLNDPTMYHNRGDSTFAGENSEYGDFFGLDDLWTERPEVVRGMTKIYADWITSTGVDGFRMDTVKHVNLDFWPQFSQGITDAANRAGKPDFFMFGEVYSADAEVTANYVRRGGLAATLDFGFQEAARGYVAADGPATVLADLYANDDLYTARDTDAGRLPTFLGNHDMGRIGSFIAGGATDPASHLRRDQLAHELMFLTRGQPVIYSGDEQGFTGPGGDKDARQPMFASRTADYLDDDLLGTDRTHAVDQFDSDHPIYRTIADLGALRRAHPALRDGVQVTRHAADGPGVFAFSRIDPDDRTEYLVAVNNAGTTQDVTVDTWSAGATFAGLYGAAATPTAGADGKLTLRVPPLAAVVYRAGTAIPAPKGKPAITITGPDSGAPVAGRAAVQAEVTGDPLATVTVASRVADGRWTLLGSADRAPYRVHHDLAGLPAGTEIEYNAVVRDSRGRTANTRSTATVGTPTQGASRDWLVVHYQRPAGGYDDWSLYPWGDIDPAWQTEWPTGQPFAGEDSYGRFAWVKLKPGAGTASFLVIDGDGTRSTVAWPVDPGDTLDPAASLDGKRYDLVVAPAGGVRVVDGELTGTYTTIGLRAGRNGLTEAQRARFPHLWQYAALTLDRRDLAKVPAALRGQLLVTERDHTGVLLTATGVQLPGVLDDLYSKATSADLGATFDNGRPTVAVWAPTAQEVALELFDTPTATPTRTVTMRRDDRTGVWSVRGARDWTGDYYRYRVRVWQPATQEMTTVSVTDPYSVSLAADSTHSQLVDLTDPTLAPAGWAKLRKPAPVASARTQIQEVSVRDFSIADASVPVDRRGTYLAFTDPASTGMRHLRSLGDAGVTHLHLLPTFDFATIPERRADQAEPDCDLAALPPDSDRQQACVAAVAETDGYNWGYDPLHYTVPEGGYATDPEGAARTAEFRRMVAGVNDAGLRVVLDVVYNHTSAAGADPKAVLDRIVPGYYHRLLGDGSVADSTCCANTAPEHAMMGKLVVDSIVTWATAYPVGLRAGQRLRRRTAARRRQRRQVAVRQAVAGRSGPGAGVRGDRGHQRPPRGAAAGPDLLAGLRPADRGRGAAPGLVPALRPERDTRGDHDAAGRRATGRAVAVGDGGLQRDTGGGDPAGDRAARRRRGAPSGAARLDGPGGPDRVVRPGQWHFHRSGPHRGGLRRESLTIRVAPPASGSDVGGACGAVAAHPNVAGVRFGYGVQRPRSRVLVRVARSSSPSRDQIIAPPSRSVRM